LKRILWVILAVILVGAVFYTVASRKAPAVATTKKKPLVAVMAVQLGDMAEVLSATGKVEASAQVDILPKVEQRIVWMPFREGDRVTAGQVLARLDTTELSRQFDQARAEERVARAVLNDLMAGSRNEEVAQALALLRQAKAGQTRAEAQFRNLSTLYDSKNLPQQAIDDAEGKVRVNEAQLSAADASVEDAQRDLERVKQVVNIGGAPAQDLDRARTRVATALAQQRASAAAVTASRSALTHVRDLYAGPIPRRELDEAAGRLAEAKAAVTAATQRYQMLQNGPTGTQVSIARERLAQAQTKVASANTLLSYSTITAPISGAILVRQRQEGDMAEPKSPIVTIANQDRLLVRASLPDRDAARLRPGMPVRVVLDAGPARQQQLKVSRVYPAADPASRLVTVEIEIPKAASAPIGSLARLSFLVSQHRGVIVAPSDAVLPRPGDRWVAFVVGAEDKAEMRDVRIGLTENDKIEILEGLSPGDRLIVRGHEMLKDGAAVKVAPAKGKGPQGGKAVSPDGTKGGEQAGRRDGQ
jgi:RND family efflux transporter MFP subunit